MFESVADLEPSQLVSGIEEAHRLQSTVMARQLALVAALLKRRTAAEVANTELQYWRVDGFEQVCAEVAAALNLSPVAASYQVHYAEVLDARLPRTAALLAAGELDWRTVQLIISRTDLVNDDDLIARLDESLAARVGGWHGWSRQRIINALDTAVLSTDPDATRQRRRRDDLPGYVQGYGVIDAEQLRELANSAALRILDDTTTAAQALRYQPSAAIERAIRCRDLTCRFPGCSRPATVCDIDTRLRSTTPTPPPAD